MERDFVRAVKRLDEHDEVLSEILGEEICLFEKMVEGQRKEEGGRSCWAGACG